MHILGACEPENDIFAAILGSTAAAGCMEAIDTTQTSRRWLEVGALSDLTDFQTPVLEST